MDAPILRVVPQRHESDCGVAVLAMLFGVTYEEALIALSWEIPTVLTSGAYTSHLKQAAKNLGSSLKVRRVFDMDDATGILCVSSVRWKTDHVVILKDGLLFDTDGTVWDADVYFKVHHAKAGALLVRS